MMKNSKASIEYLKKAQGIRTESLEILRPEKKRPIGRYGRLHKEYLKHNKSSVFETMVRLNILWDYLANVNEKAQLMMRILSDDCPDPEHCKQAEELVLKLIVYRFEFDK